MLDRLVFRFDEMCGRNKRSKFRKKPSALDDVLKISNLLLRERCCQKLNMNRAHTDFVAPIVPFNDASELLRWLQRRLLVIAAWANDRLY